MNDKDIVELFWNRNEKAINEVSEKYESYCRKIAFNILGNEEDSKECINDAYLNLWNSIPPHRPEKLSAYLGKIVRNLAYNAYKKNTAKKRGGSQVPLIFEELSDIVSVDDYDSGELTNIINKFLNKLPDQSRKIFVLRYFYSDSIKAISEKCGMKENYVSVTLSRIRTQLNQYLTENGVQI